MLSHDGLDELGASLEALDAVRIVDCSLLLKTGIGHNIGFQALISIHKHGQYVEHSTRHPCGVTWA